MGFSFTIRNFCACIALCLLYIQGGQAQASTICISRKNWSSGLTLARLERMTYIFMGKHFAPNGYVPPVTFIFVPECPKLSTFGHVYYSEKPLHAEDSMTMKCGLPSEFFLTSAPCPDCALMLMNKYKAEKKKPTIYIARPYIGKGKTSKGNKSVNMQCQAMLVQAGFNLKQWDWDSFKGYIDTPECEDAIDTMQQNENYTKRYIDTKTALTKIQDMANTETKGYYKKKCENVVKG